MAHEFTRDGSSATEAFGCQAYCSSSGGSPSGSNRSSISGNRFLLLRNRSMVFERYNQRKSRRADARTPPLKSCGRSGRPVSKSPVAASARDDTRERLLRAAMKVFARDGYAGRVPHSGLDARWGERNGDRGGCHSREHGCNPRPSIAPVSGGANNRQDQDGLLGWRQTVTPAAYVDLPNPRA